MSSNNNTQSVVLAGVGGQGILLASEVTAKAAMNEGHDVKTNEVHGMAQRGGSVIAQIRYGKKVHSPLVEKGTARALCALERIEALRYADYLMPGGLVVVNSQVITPVTVSMGAATYPDNAEEMMRNQFENLVYFDAGQKCVELGDIRAANIMLLGVLSTGLDISPDSWLAAIRDTVKPKFIDLNLEAFEAGRQMIA